MMSTVIKVTNFIFFTYLNFDYYVHKKTKITNRTKNKLKTLKFKSN